MSLEEDTTEEGGEETGEDASGEKEKAKAEAKKAMEREAEEWRANPVFRKDEVTITQLGARFMIYLYVRASTDCVEYSDETENVAILVSEWLELDAPDEWVRNDAEIVRSGILIFVLVLVLITYTFLT